MADINVLDLTPTTPGSNDSLILFDRTTGEGKSTRFDTLSSQVLDSKFGDSNPVAGQELSYDATTGKYKNTSQIASLNEALANKDSEIKSILTTGGVKNFFKVPLWSLWYNPWESSGITIVATADKNAITINGTSNSTFDSAIWPRTLIRQGNIYLPNGNYICTIHDENGDIIDDGSVPIYIGTTSGGAFHRVSNTTNNGVNAFTIDDSFTYDYVNERGEKLIAPYIYVKAGETYNNKYVKFMIRPASIVDSTFVQYAETNRELTDDINSDWKTITNFISSALTGTLYYKKVGKMLYIALTVSITSAGGGITANTMYDLTSIPGIVINEQFRFALTHTNGYGVKTEVQLILSANNGNTVIKYCSGETINAGSGSMYVSCVVPCN